MKKEINVLGRVSDKVKKILGIILESDSDDWFFVSYAPYNFGLDSTFTVDEKPVKLLKVTQQLNVEENIIPQGWKTICKFDFPNGIPKSFKNLLTISNWEGTGIKITVDNPIDAWENNINMTGWDSRPEKYK